MSVTNGSWSDPGVGCGLSAHLEEELAHLRYLCAVHQTSFQLQARAFSFFFFFNCKLGLFLASSSYSSKVELDS